MLVCVPFQKNTYNCWLASSILPHPCCVYVDTWRMYYSFTIQYCPSSSFTANMLAACPIHKLVRYDQLEVCCEVVGLLYVQYTSWYHCECCVGHASQHCLCAPWCCLVWGTPHSTACAHHGVVLCGARLTALLVCAMVLSCVGHASQHCLCAPWCCLVWGTPHITACAHHGIVLCGAHLTALPVCAMVLSCVGHASHHCLCAPWCCLVWARLTALLVCTMVLSCVGHTSQHCLCAPWCCLVWGTPHSTACAHHGVVLCGAHLTALLVRTMVLSCVGHASQHSLCAPWCCLVWGTPHSTAQ